MLIYQVFAYFGPLIKTRSKRMFLVYVGASLILALGGIVFAYMVSLPAALHFLMNFGASSDIKSLITANEYFNFVLTYIAGFAVMFQIPLIVLLIDTIKPVSPGGLLKASRYVILASFIVAAVLTPTPDPVNQVLMAGPVIALYFMSICVVWVRSVVRSKRVVVNDTINPLPSAQFVNSGEALRTQPVTKQRAIVSDIVQPSMQPVRSMVSQTSFKTSGKESELNTPILGISGRRVISDFILPSN